MRDLVCDTSVLQYLHIVGQLDLLPHLAKNIIVPPAVCRELEAGRDLGASLPVPERLGWVSIPEVVPPLIAGLSASLGEGEVEVISLAFHLKGAGAVAALDDRSARHAAERLGVAYTGTMGLLLDAKRVGLIERVSPLVDALLRSGFRASPAFIGEVVRQAGEAE